jgi:hypothetical protein
MPGLSSRAALLPALGLCSCAAATSRTADALEAPEPEPESPTPTWIEHDSPRTVPTVFEAAVHSGQLALARGEYAAARESLTAALAYEESALMVTELRLAEVDALIGQGNLQTAQQVLDTLRNDSTPIDSDIAARNMTIREHEHARGLVDACEARVDSEPRTLPRHEDFLAAWNDVRDGFPRKADLPIPTDEHDARTLLCESCILEEPSFAALELGEDQIVWSLVLEHVDSGVSVLPELTGGTMSDSCADDVEMTAQRHGDLLWVRAFSDARDEFDPGDWALGDEAGLGAVAPSPTPTPSYYAAGSSGYQSSGYQGSGYVAGYQGSGYQGSGYHYHAYYGCGGGYDYGPYETCALTSSIERDVFIDLARGEIVLDIVRTGKPMGAMGFVRLDRDAVHVDACGVTQTLPLSLTT